MECLKCNVRGRVQGVGFRWSTKRTADSLNLKGYAINKPDGAVEILICGTGENIEKFNKWLESGGPAFARITEVNCEKFSVNTTPDTFEVL